jgi:TonB family protein
MSYVPSTKSFPEIVKSIPKAVNHPTGIAVLASVAIHGLLGLSLPYLSKSSSEGNSSQKRNIQLVKLTPEELGRVAQQAPTAPLPLPTQNQQFAPLPGSPYTAFPPLNFNSSSSGNSALFNIPSTIADSPKNQLANSLTSPSPNVKTSPSPNVKTSPSPNVTTSPSPNIQTSPSPTTKQTLKTAQTNPDLPIVRVDNFPTRGSRLRGLDLSNRPDGGNIPYNNLTPAPLPPAPPPFVGSNFSAPQTMQPEFSNNSRSPIAANPTSTPTALQSAPVTATPPGNSVPLSSLPSQEQATQLLRQQLSSQGDNLRPNSTNTTNEEARNNYIAYMSKANQLQAGELSITGAYPQEACSKQIAGTSVVMLTVGADGKASSPQMIKSSGYGIFDDQAIAAAQANRFENNTGQPKPYKVSVDFKYDKAFCPSVTSPQEATKPQNSAKPIELIKPTEAAKPQNSSESKKPSEALSSPEPKKSPESAITTDQKKLPEPPNLPAPKK